MVCGGGSGWSLSTARRPQKIWNRSYLKVVVTYWQSCGTGLFSTQVKQIAGRSSGSASGVPTLDKGRNTEESTVHCVFTNVQCPSVWMGNCRQTKAFRTFNVWQVWWICIHEVMPFGHTKCQKFTKQNEVQNADSPGTVIYNFRLKNLNFVTLLNNILQEKKKLVNATNLYKWLVSWFPSAVAQ